MQLWDIACVQREGDGAVFLRVDDKVGGNLLYGTPHHFAHRSAWLGIQFAQFFDECLSLYIGKLELLLQLIPMFFGEELEIVLHRLQHQVLQLGGVTTLYL